MSETKRVRLAAMDSGPAIFMSSRRSAQVSIIGPMTLCLNAGRTVSKLESDEHLLS